MVFASFPSAMLQVIQNVMVAEMPSKVLTLFMFLHEFTTDAYQRLMDDSLHGHINYPF